MAEPIQDIHKFTLENDAQFHAWMDVTRGEDWRTKLTPIQQRYAAKQWNFYKIYGVGNISLEKLLKSPF